MDVKAKNGPFNVMLEGLANSKRIPMNCLFTLNSVWTNAVTSRETLDCPPYEKVVRREPPTQSLSPTEPSAVPV